MIGKLICKGGTGKISTATVLDNGSILEIELTSEERLLLLPELAKRRGWEKPTDKDMEEYRELRGPGPTIILGPGVEEKLKRLLRDLGKER